MKKVKASGAAVATVALAAASVVAFSAPAQASQNSVCYVQNVCFYYSPNYAGAKTGFDDGNIPDLIYPTTYLWPNNGAGAGQWVGNNAASAYNTHSAHVAYIFYSANFNGIYKYLGPGGYDNLGDLRNNNRSFRISE